MKELNLNVKVLASALTKVSKVILSNPVLPILGGVMFTKEENGNILLTASSLEMSARVNLVPEKDTLKTGDSFVIDAGNLTGILAVAKNSETICFVFGGDSVSIAFGTSKFDLPTELGSDFPNLPLVEDSANVVYFDESYIKTFQDVAICCSKDDLRPAMTGVFFDLHKGENENELLFDVVATDAHRLNYAANLPFSGELSENISCIIPFKTINILGEFMSGEFSLTLTKVNAFFKSGDYEISVRLIDAKFPSWQAVVPKNENEFKIENDLFLNAVKTVSIAANTNTNLVRFNLHPESGKLKLKAEDLDYSKRAYTDIDFCDFNDKAKEQGDMAVGVNSKLLISLLPKHGKDVTVSYSTPNRALLIKSSSVITTLLMPLMLENNNQ